MTGTADISSCGQYRYTLTREWEQLYPPCEDHHDANVCPPVCRQNGPQKVVFVMLNPSTADAQEDDPTIRRCIAFAKSWGFSGLIVANLYALRSTDPKALWAHHDPVGPLNDAVLAALAHEHWIIVCAWGANAPAERAEQFLRIVKGSTARLHCLGTTKAGAPRHPLYLRKDARLAEWPASSGEKGND